MLKHIVTIKLPAEIIVKYLLGIMIAMMKG